MSLRKENYIDRLIDKKIEEYLSVFGAISIEGPKWCGKTWASLNHANSKVLLDDEETKEKAKLDLNLILNDEKPELIDEWNLIPEVWDAVRRKCDDTTEKGNYILTCSTKLTDAEQKEKIHHSGAGRIGKLEMHTMSLYESGDSTGKVSIQDMLNAKLQNDLNEKITLDKLAHLIIRGGWPSNIKTEESKASIIPKSYIKAILDKDIHDDKKRDVNKMNMLLKSLARNESTIANKNTLLKDIEENAGEKELIESRITIDDYLDVLNRLHIIENQDAYSANYRSPDRIGKSSKRHFTDPSLACACLDLTKDKLINDLKTFGFMFEALVERDLKIYMDYLEGRLFHFRDNVTGLEVDSILEFNGGEYAAVEIKLGYHQVEEAKKNLINFSNNMIKKPKFMCVIVGYTDVIAKDPETGIYIVPITALKP
ncbi:MAG: ATP-binding protein [Clostridia bacterium]|nr:ATP-binding protein [Clostridia bacterium]